MPHKRADDPAAERSGSAESPSISSLLKRLGNETGELVRAEVALAKLEFRELAGQAARDGIKVGVALALALVGALALTAWGVLALGEVMGGRHGTAALIIGVAFLLIGGLLARSAMRSLARGTTPSDAVQSLKQDSAWAARELRELKGSVSGERSPAALGKPVP